MLAPERMSRALKRVAPSRLEEGQEAFPLLYGTETVPASDTPATEIAAAAKASSSTFYNEEGRFVPRCACEAYGTFGVGVSLRHGREGTWWCGPCWRTLVDSKGQASWRSKRSVPGSDAA